MCLFIEASLIMSDDDEANYWSINSSSALNVSGFSDEKHHFNCSTASLLLETCSSRFSVVKTVLVPAVCLVGIVGNLITLSVVALTLRIVRWRCGHGGVEV